MPGFPASAGGSGPRRPAEDGSTNRWGPRRRENAWNHGRRKQGNASSQFIGVYREPRNPEKCYARVTCDGAATNLGPFDDEVEAAQARDQKALELHGEFAYLNFPEALQAEDDRP